MFNPGQRDCPSALSGEFHALCNHTLSHRRSAVGHVTMVKLITRAFRHTYVGALSLAHSLEETFLYIFPILFPFADIQSWRQHARFNFVSDHEALQLSIRGWKRPWRLSIGSAFSLARRRAFCYIVVIGR